MKKLIIMFGTLLVIAASCTINQTFVYDDGYYTALQHQNAMIERQSRANLATQNVPVAEAAPAVEQVYLDENSDYSTTSSYMTDDGTTYVTNNYYFNGDNYYDYEYTARLRRFYGVNYGWSYYDPYFTNQYWYNYNPACWGVSIYYGYNFWWDDPWYYRPYYYRPHYYYRGWNWGWGWNDYHYYAYHPYRPHHHHHHHFGGSYRPDGFRGDYYHNNHDRNYAFNYGHRNSVQV